MSASGPGRGMMSHRLSALVPAWVWVRDSASNNVRAAALDAFLQEVLKLLELRRDRIVEELVANLHGNAGHKAGIDLRLEREGRLAGLLLFVEDAGEREHAHERGASASVAGHIMDGSSRAARRASAGCA